MKSLQHAPEHFNRNNQIDDPASCPIVREHWLRNERTPGSFAEEAAKDAHRRGWTPPEDFTFVDRPPPGVAPVAKAEPSQKIGRAHV